MCGVHICNGAAPSRIHTTVNTCGGALGAINTDELFRYLISICTTSIDPSAIAKCNAVRPFASFVSTSVLFNCNIACVRKKMVHMARGGHKESAPEPHKTQACMHACVYGVSALSGKHIRIHMAERGASAYTPSRMSRLYLHRSNEVSSFPPRRQS